MYFSVFRRVGFNLKKREVNTFINRVTKHLFLLKTRHVSKSAFEKSNGSSLKSLLQDAADFEAKDPLSNEWTSPVYPILTKRNQAQHSIRPQVDPRKTTVLMFPGQGTQYVGMAKGLIDLPNVREMFDSASEILRYNLYDLCVHGPKDMLDMTSHCQAAVCVASLAAVEKLHTNNPEMINTCVATAGFSVGEYTALVFAGAIEFEDAIRLLKIRGEAMQAASELRNSGMMTVFLKHGAKIKQACAAAREWCLKRNIEESECNIASYLLPDCKVISGDMEALKFLEMNAAEFLIKKIKYIPVSGGFHSNLMKPAKEVLKNALKNIEIKSPLIPMHSNVDGKPYSNPERIRENLVKQLCSPVAWEQTMHILFERTPGTPFPDVFECGPGQTLRTLLKHNNAKAYERCSSVSA